MAVYVSVPCLVLVSAVKDPTTGLSAHCRATVRSALHKMAVVGNTPLDLSQLYDVGPQSHKLGLSDLKISVKVSDPTRSVSTATRKCMSSARHVLCVVMGTSWAWAWSSCVSSGGDASCAERRTTLPFSLFCLRNTAPAFGLPETPPTRVPLPWLSAMQIWRNARDSRCTASTCTSRITRKLISPSAKSSR